MRVSLKFRAIFILALASAIALLAFSTLIQPTGLITAAQSAGEPNASDSANVLEPAEGSTPFDAQATVTESTDEAPESAGPNGFSGGGGGGGGSSGAGSAGGGGSTASPVPDSSPQTPPSSSNSSSPTPTVFAASFSPSADEIVLNEGSTAGFSISASQDANFEWQLDGMEVSS